MTISELTTVTEKTEVSSGTISIGASDLLDLLTGAIIATGKDDTLPTLTGISLVAGDNMLTATSTDRYRMITGALKVESESVFTALLQNKDAAKVITALKPIAKRNDPRDIMLVVGKGYAIFTLPDQTFTFRALDGTFPKYEYLLGKVQTTSAE